MTRRCVLSTLELIWCAALLVKASDSTNRESGFRNVCEALGIGIKLELEDEDGCKELSLPCKSLVLLGASDTCNGFLGRVDNGGECRTSDYKQQPKNINFKTQYYGGVSTMTI
jgi:hypothetical protein